MALAAHQLKEGILVALLNKYKSGKGSVVEVSLFDAAIASLVNQASTYINTNEIPSLIGSLHPNIAPYGEIFITLDNKKMVLAIGSDNQFYKLCDVLNLNNVATNTKYKINVMRVKNRVSLFKLLNQAIKQRSYFDLNSEFESKNIPFGLIKNLKEVIDNLDSNKFLEYPNKQHKVLKSSVFKINSL